MKDSGINLFGGQSGLDPGPEAGRRAARRKGRRGSSFNFITFIRDIAYKFEPKSRSR